MSFNGSQSKFEKISWFIDRSRCTQKSNEQKPDWFGLSSSFSSMSLKWDLNISRPRSFSKIGKSENGRKSFMRPFSRFLWSGATFPFVQRLRNLFSSFLFLNMIVSSFTKFLSYTFNILMEASSCPLALLILSVLIIVYIFPNYCVYVSLFLLKDYIETKYLLKRLTFPLKFVTISLFTERGRIIGTVQSL